jgi:hypothetical protein
MTSTFSTPETVTIPGAVAVEALALLEAFANVCGEFRDDHDTDELPFHRLTGPVVDALDKAFPDPSNGMGSPPSFDAMLARAHELEPEIRKLMGESTNAFRIASLERSLLALGQEVIGVMRTDRGKWVTPEKFFAELKEARDAS